MTLILLSTVVLSQVLLVLWRRKHPRSYQLVTFTGLTLIPLLYGIAESAYRFLGLFLVFFICNAHVLYLASRRPLNHKTPSLVYKWFAGAYRLTFGLGTFAYALFLLHMCTILTSEYTIEIMINCFICSVYFGVLIKDLVDICSDRMAATLGYYSKDGFPSKSLGPSVCAICGVLVDGPLRSISSHKEADEEEDEEEEERQNMHLRLNCGHVFHSPCIKGWCLIGKRDTCPYCKEKVDMKKISKNPWDKQQYLYVIFLEWVRYLVVWQPVVLLLVDDIYATLGLK